MAQWNASQKDVQVEPTYTGSYADTANKVIASLAASALPDGGLIPAAPLFTGRAGNYKILEHMSGPDGLDMDDFFPVLWDYNKFGGKVSSLPFNNSTPVLHYNKDIMKSVGLNSERPPQTWDELLAMGKKIISTGAWAVTMNNPDWMLKALILQNGGKIMNDAATKPLFNSAEGIEAMAFIKQLVDQKLMPAGMHARAREQFIGGRSAFHYDTTGAINTILSGAKFGYGTGFLPKKKKYAVTVGGAALALFPSTKEREAATWKFLKWLVSKDVNIRWVKGTGYVPIRRSVLTSPEIQSLFAEMPQYKAGFEQLEVAESYEHFWEMGAMDSLLAEAVDKVERGVLTPKQAMDEATSKLVAEMSRK